MPRIAFGGIQHETNTFAPSPATYADFEQPDGWPGLATGAEIFAAVAGINLPIAGFIEAAQGQGHELLPLSWSSATPSAQVTEDAFERLIADMMARLAALGPVDAVYLDLHGAMVTAHLEDGEGAVLARVRARVGPEVPIVASLDLHANITPEMIDLADCLVAYRSYPHIDFADTGARAAGELDRLLRGNVANHKAFRQFPFLIPVLGGCTLYEPAQSLYARLPELEDRPGVDHVTLAMGFGPADIYHCGPSVCAYGSSQEAAEAAAEALAEEVLAREAEFLLPVLTPANGVARAIELAVAARRPVVLADSQDNPGGGGNGDTVGLLEELVGQRAEDAVLAILYDPAAATAAHAAGEGAALTFGLGAKSGLAGHRPLEATYQVERLGDGRMTGTGPFYKGARMELGPMALLRLGGVRVVVASRKLQAADQSCFRHLGVEPAEQKILALKSSVHFRADFQPIAEDILVVAAPGPNPLDHNELTYRNLRPGVRVMPRAPRL